MVKKGGNMKSIKDWKAEKELDGYSIIHLNREQLLEVSSQYFRSCLTGNLKTVYEMKNSTLHESAETSRYSIHIDYRTTMDDALDGFAKLVLGYVSAGLKKMGFHTKHVFTEKPLRLLVSSRNWDDGEWTGLVSWSEKDKCFLISKGFYNKDRKTISIQSTKKCADNAAEITKELHNTMHSLKGQPNKHIEKLKPAQLKRGPK